MKKIKILFLVLCLVFSFTSCDQKKDENEITAGDIVQENYSGVVVERFTEGSGDDLKEYLKVEIGENNTKVFTLTNSTQISGSDQISVGDTVEIACEGYKNSVDRSIIKMTVIPMKSDLTPMVMVNDALYYDTGKESVLSTHPDTMDGEITSAVDSTKIPTENNQSNFGSGYGYQYGENGTIEVCQNGKWFVFEQKWLDYTFEDSNWNVKFSVQYPESWKLTEQPGYDGDEEHDGSRSIGIQFTVFNSSEEMVSIMAMLFVPFEVDETLYQSEPFETSTGLTGTKYINNTDGRVWVYFIFGNGETLPQYSAAVTMSTANYEAKKNDIEAVMKTLQIFTD